MTYTLAPSGKAVVLVRRISPWSTTPSIAMTLICNLSGCGLIDLLGSYTTQYKRWPGPAASGMAVCPLGNGAILLRRIRGCQTGDVRAFSCRLRQRLTLEAQLIAGAVDEHATVVAHLACEDLAAERRL